MAYPQLATAPAAALLKTHEEVEKKLDALKKAKGDSKKIAALNKDYETSGRALATKYVADMKIARAGANTMLLQVESYHTEALKGLQSARTAMEAYKKTQDGKQLSAIDAAPAFIKTLAELTKKEIDAFVASWSEYRDWKPDCNASFIKEGDTLRTQTVEVSRSAPVKQQKIASMVQEAATVKSAAAGSAGGGSAADALATAKALRESIDAMAAPLEAGPGSITAVTKVAEQFVVFAESPVEKLQEILKSLESRYAATVKTVQGFTTTVASMQRVLDTGTQGIDATFLKDPKVAAELKEPTESVAFLKERVKGTQAKIADMAKHLKAAQDRVKAGGLKGNDPDKARADVSEMIGKQGLKGIAKDPKVLAAFSQHAASVKGDDQLAVYLMCNSKPTGKRAADIFVKYIKVGVPKQANISGDLRKTFENKHAAFVATKKESELSGLPWERVQNEIEKMMNQHVKSFMANLGKYF